MSPSLQTALSPQVTSTYHPLMDSPVTSSPQPTTPWGPPAIPLTPNLLGSPSPSLGVPTTSRGPCHHQSPAPSHQPPPLRINPPSTRGGRDPLSVPGDAHLEEVWGHLLLAQTTLDMLRGTLGEGL